MRNWDFEPRFVSQATKQYLSLMSGKPVINIKQENPKLFAVVQELDQVHQLRKNIIILKFSIITNLHIIKGILYRLAILPIAILR